MQFDPIFLANYLDAIERQNMPRYAKGGKVVDLLAESLFGGKKATKTAPDPSRRKIMGLDPKTVEPGQVAVKETVSKAPKSGTTSVTLEEIANIPMSRRDVLRMGAGQLGRGLMPQGALGSMMELAGEGLPQEAIEQAIQQATRPSRFVPSTIQGYMAQALKKGYEDDKIARLATKRFPDSSFYEDELAEGVIPSLRNPFEGYYIDDERFAPGPLHIMRTLLGNPDSSELRSVLREVNKANPDLYRTLKEAAKDTNMTIAEMTPFGTYERRLDDAMNAAKKSGQRFDLDAFHKRFGYDPDDLPTEDFLDSDDF